MPTIVIASEAGLAVRAVPDILELPGAVFGADGLLLREGDLGPAVFDLRSGLAGELFQKRVNYRVRTALILHDPAAHGERFAAPAHEHARHPTVRFFTEEGATRRWLAE